MMTTRRRVKELEAKHEAEVQRNKDWQKVIEQALQDGLKLVLGIIGEPKEPNSKDEQIKTLNAMYKGAKAKIKEQGEQIEAQERTIEVLMKGK